MITIGVDAHKRVHAAVAVDAAGRELAHWRGPNTEMGWRQLAAWAADLDGACRWGIEGAWNYGRGLAQSLVAAGAAVYEVNARWTALGRRQARRQDKNDHLDARAVAHFVWREAEGLPQVTADDEAAPLHHLRPDLAWCRSGRGQRRGADTDRAHTAGPVRVVAYGHGAHEGDLRQQGLS